MSKLKFKKGDTVQRTEGQWETVKAGDICTVVSADWNGLTLLGHSGVYDEEMFHKVVLAPVESKKITVDVCHRLVAYDCEISGLQARLDNLREDYERQLSQLEGSISTLTFEMETLKSEYNVEE